MSLVAIALVIGLAFCIERIIYLSLAEINTKKFLAAIEAALEKGDVEAAKDIARSTRGPIASIYYQGLLRIDQGLDVVEKSVVSYGGVQAGYLEKGCSWITLFIAMAPSLGFLGTVIGIFLCPILLSWQEVSVMKKARLVSMSKKQRMCFASHLLAMLDISPTILSLQHSVSPHYGH